MLFEFEFDNDDELLLLLLLFELIVVVVESFELFESLFLKKKFEIFCKLDFFSNLFDFSLILKLFSLNSSPLFVLLLFDNFSIEVDFFLIFELSNVVKSELSFFKSYVLSNEFDLFVILIEFSFVGIVSISILIVS